MVRIELFGNLQITCGQQPVTQLNTNRLRSLLAFLVLHREAPQQREHVAFLLWPESQESQARTNLRQLLHHMRRALPAECSFLTADNHTVQWRRDPSCAIDVVEFDESVARAAGAKQRGHADDEISALEEAASLYQDDLARGLYDEWLQPKREEYRRQLEEVLGRLTKLHEENRNYPAAIRHAERLVGHDPIREVYHQWLIRLHAGNRDRASALRAYHQCMRILRRELGVEPGRETREAFDAVLKSAPAERAPTDSPAATTRLPANGPMVGRKKEWERLVECWRQQARGQTQLAALLGEPGIGKSRLAEEVYDWCLDRQEPVGRTRCYAAQGQLAYAPIAEWLRAEPLRAACMQLPRPQLAELARVLPEILAENTSIKRPGPLTESWERHHFYESLNAAFGKARKPLLLLIDDLQWCDQDSFEWLHSLFRCEACRGILVLATVRPEETGRNHPFTRLLSELQQSGQAVEFPLAPLDAGETAELAAQVCDRQLDAADMVDLYRATQGNPLFVLESIRAGLPGRRGDAACGTAAPPRIFAVISGRLAQLSPRAYELAGLASAIGRAFSFDLLAKATDWDEDSVSRALDELWQRRIIGGQGNGRSAGYDFTHDRLREVAYAELSPVRRRFLHRRVARALEESNAAIHADGTAGISGQLGAHYEAAGMAEAAIRHFRQAADVAHRRYADAEAADLLRRALSLCRDFPENAGRDQQELELLAALGHALVTIQGYATPEVGATYARALELSQRLGERDHLVSVLSGSWVFHIVRGELEKSREMAQRFLDLEDAEALAVAGHFLLGSSLFHMGLFAASKEQLMRALQGYSDHSNHPALTLFAGPDIGVFCRSYLAQIVFLLGYGDQAVKSSEEAIAEARRLAHPFSLNLALNYSAMMQVFRRDSVRARELAEEAVGICRMYGFAYYLQMAEILAGWSRSREGDAEGLVQLRNGLEALKATGAELRTPFYHGLLAEACAAEGRTGEALANISIGFAFQNQNGETWISADLHRIQGDVLLKAGEAGAAAACFQRALEAARQMGTRLFELRAAARLCGLQKAADKPTADHSEATLESLYQSFTEDHDAPDLREAATLLRDTGHQVAKARRNG